MDFIPFYLPGCPPEAERIWDAIVAILEGKLPAPGSVIGAETTVCEERLRSRMELTHDEVVAICGDG